MAGKIQEPNHIKEYRRIGEGSTAPLEDLEKYRQKLRESLLLTNCATFLTLMKLHYFDEWSQHEPYQLGLYLARKSLKNVSRFF